MRRIELTETDTRQWLIRVYDYESRNIWPMSLKKNAREMIARLQQILDVGPSSPQDGPDTEDDLRA